ncbi:MAG: ATP-binding cassette domain-containing protein [Anaerolineae bacterium]|nr:ATP-binding cassette domain-containing protein [Anaerolineae bacterium]
MGESAGNGAEYVLETRALKMHFHVGSGGLLGFGKHQTVQAVDGVSLQIRKGETLGLVGESGCGKSTLGRAILLLYRPTAGEVIFQGRSLLRLDREELRSLRRHMQIIFQDPLSSLNPRMTIGTAVGEPIREHGIATGPQVRERVEELLRLVGLNPSFINRYPHEFSGGQQQRIGVARALSLDPDFIVCDEPVSALDISIQAQIINLLEDLQERLNLTYLFISHDLRVVRHISDRVAVMYLGQIVELADTDELYENPLHPYTRALLSAVPVVSVGAKQRRARIILEGEVPSPINPPSGCRFRTRCPIASADCGASEPELVMVSPSHFVACHPAAAGQLR